MDFKLTHLIQIEIKNIDLKWVAIVVAVVVLGMVLIATLATLVRSQF